MGEGLVALAKEVSQFGKEPISGFIRTPDERFKNLPGFPWSPHYLVSLSHTTLSGEGPRIHFIDEGPKNAKTTFLLMHGEPTWSYLYRHMIPILLERGDTRVVAPDLVGFGKSDKPLKQSDVTYERMVDWMSDVVTQLRLQNVTLFAQDWGGLIGLRLVARFPEKFARVCIGDTALPQGEGASKSFVKWATVQSQQVPSWGLLLQMATNRNLSEEEAMAYEAPFPSEEYKAASRVMPKLVASSPHHPSVLENKAAAKVLSNFEKPFLTVWGGLDKVLPADRIAPVFHNLVPGAKSQNHVVLPNAGHFLQEDDGPVVASHLLKFVDSNPLPPSSKL